MSNTLDFENGNDSGAVSQDSISPVQNGEPAQKATFNRPLETLRKRSEVLRIEANENRWVRDADRATAIWLEGGGIDWSLTTGKLTLEVGATLFMASMVGPGEGRGDFREKSGGKFPSRFAFLQEVSGTTEFRVVAKKYAYEGSNAVTLTLVDSNGGGNLTLEVTGNPVVNPATQPGRTNIVVTFDATLGHTLQNVVDLINNDYDASELVEAVAVAGATDPAFAVAKTSLKGGLDGIYHEISKAVLSNVPQLNEGDVLALWMGVEARRSSVEGEGNHLITSPNLVNLSDIAYHDASPNALPIGRVLNGEFTFVNGTAVKDGETITSFSEVNARAVTVDSSGWVHLGAAANAQESLDDIDGSLDVLDAAVTLDGSGWTTVPDASAVQTAFDNVDGAVTTNAGDTAQLRDDLSNDNPATPPPGSVASGAGYIGMNTSSFTSLPVGTGTDSVSSVLTAIDGELNIQGNSQSAAEATIKPAYQRVEGAIAATSPGDCVVVSAYYPDAFPGNAVVDNTQFTGTDFTHKIVTDGRYLFATTADFDSPPGVKVLRFNLSDFAGGGAGAGTPTVIKDIPDVSTWAGSSSELLIDTDGEVVVYTLEDTVYCHDANTLIENWNTYIAFPIGDLCVVPGVGVYLTTAGGDAVYRLDYTDGTIAQTASGAVSGIPQAVKATGGGAVFVTTDDGAGNGRLYGLTSSMGVLSSWGTNPVTWTGGAALNELKTDGEYVFLRDDSTLRCYVARTGVLVFTKVFENATDSVDHIDVDDRYVYAVSADDVEVYDKKTGDYVDMWDYSLGSAQLNCITTDGALLYIGYQNSGMAIQGMSTGQKPRIWQRVSSTDKNRRPFFNLLLPGE